MTVGFLRQQLQPGPCQRDYSRGYSQCWRDCLHFLSASSNTEVSIAPLEGLQHQEQQLRQTQRSSSSSLRPNMPQDSSSKGPVWRPW
ncbi:hypothetical protein LDENG_00296180 [Lucifuga dentata]|nr:hypothetical protein LDENG_00296180 [Lucifuga dentata]